MNLPAILDIAITLIFIYLILSLLSSEIQEIIAALLQWRAKNLKKAIETLLSGSVKTEIQSQTGKENPPQPLVSVQAERPTNEETRGQLPIIKEVDVKKTITLARDLYEHPLIQSLNQTTLGRLTRSHESGPSYIPSETFASALSEILKLDEKLQEFRANKEFDKSIVNAVNDIQRSDLPINLKASLIVLAKRAKRKANKIDDEVYQFEREVETWFNGSMERASGVYKRNAKGFAIVVGSLIALGVNADTLHIFSMLSKDSVLSAGISQYANQTVQNCKKRNLPPDGDGYLNCIGSQVNNNELSKLSLPIGWNFSIQTPKDPLPIQAPENPLIVIWNILKKIIGWLLTGLAISMGATFWFDLFNRFINVRYAGKKPTVSEKNSDSSR